MARTPSNHDLALGSPCPAFELECVLCHKALGRDDIFGGVDDERGRRGLLVAFVSVHCPFVQHMEQAFTALAKEFAGSVATVCIMSNDVAEYPEDSPEHMREQGQRLGWDMDTKSEGCHIPYLFDSSQETAREFHAACTPDLYLFNQAYELVYHAQFDGTRPYRNSDNANGVPRDPAIHADANGRDLRAAIEALLSGEPMPTPGIPSLGCNIKWRA